MIKDGFNDIKITNDSQTKGVEFGPTQKTEFSEQGETQLHRSAYNPNLVKKANTTTNIETTTTAEAIAPASEATVIASSTTASTIAATTTSIAVVASTVAVTAISVVTGISISLHDYQFQFNSFLVTSDSLTYELLVVDNKNRPDDRPYEQYEEGYYPDEHLDEEDYKEPLTLRVYNNDYDYSIGVWLDYPNYGSFSNLKLHESYHIVLSENRYGGEILFDEEFVTQENAGVTSFYVSGQANSKDNTIELYVDYIDEINALSDFTLTIKNDDKELAIPFETKYGWQTVSLGDNEIEYSKTYDYTFSYRNNGDVYEYSSGTVTFYDTFSGESTFREMIWDKTANFKEHTFDIQLDYVDDYDAYDQFVLSFFMEDSGLEIAIPLYKTTDVQTIETDLYDISLSNTYSYELSCLYYGEQTILDSGEVAFTDNSGAVVQFNGLIFNETANFDKRTFDLQLDYQDDLDYLYGFKFTLTDLETSESMEFNLNKTTDVQTFDVSETLNSGAETETIYRIDVVEHQMMYSFEYWNMDQQIIVESGKEFKFKNSLVSTFIDFESPYDFVSNTNDGPFMLPVKFVFDDAAHVYNDFNVVIMVDDEQAGHLVFEEQNAQPYWQYGTYVADNEMFSAEDLTETLQEIKVIISTILPETEENPEGEVTVWSQPATFTLNEKTEVYDATVVNNKIYYGMFEINVLPVYAGAPDNIECQLIIECQTGNTYTCNLFLQEKMVYCNALLTECEEGFNEEEFGNDFAEPVKISLRYCTLSYETGDVTGDPIKSDYQTLVLYDSFKFELSA